MGFTVGSADVWYLNREEWYCTTSLDKRLYVANNYRDTGC